MSSLTFHVEGPVAILALQRPDKRNAISGEMWQAMITGVEELDRLPDTCCLIVTGSGGSFSAGADLAEARDSSGDESVAYRALAEAGLAAMRRVSLPTVAVIDGPAIGAGCLLALACDVRFASPRSRFAIPAVRYGFEVEPLGLQRLVALMGPGQASRFLLAAGSVGGERACNLGLVDELADDPMGLARDFAAEVARGDAGTARLTKEAIWRATGE